VYGYPVDLAAAIAVSTVRSTVALFPTIAEVVFCCFSPAHLAVYERALEVDR